MSNFKSEKGLLKGKMTIKASTALVAAESIAKGYGHADVAPSHVLLGILDEGSGLGIKTLQMLGVDVKALEQAIHDQLDQSTPALQGEASAGNVIERAVNEARSFNHSYVGQEHLLLALVGVESGVAVDLLRRFGVTYDSARGAVYRLLSEGRPPIEMKRYNLAMPEDLFREVEQLAQRQNSTVVEVLRRFVKLGLYVTAIQESPGGAILVREDGREREIVIL